MKDAEEHDTLEVATAKADRFIFEWSDTDDIPEQSKETMINAAHVLFAFRRGADDEAWLLQLYNTLFAAWNLGRADGEEIEPR